MTTKPKKDPHHRPIEFQYRGKFHVGRYYVEDGKDTVWCQFGSDSAVVHDDDAPERALTMFGELLRKAHYTDRI
jgi:hypothetical protein